MLHTGFINEKCHVFRPSKNVLRMPGQNALTLICRLEATRSRNPKLNYADVVLNIRARSLSWLIPVFYMPVCLFISASSVC